MAIQNNRFILTVIFFVTTMYFMSSCVPTPTDIFIMIGDNDGYGYGHSQVPDNATLSPNPSPPLSGPCEGFGWIFDNRDDELTASDGSQHTDQEPCSGRSFSFTIPFTPVDPGSFSSAAFILDVSGIQMDVFGDSYLYLDGIDFSSYLPRYQLIYGSNVITIDFDEMDASLFSDGSLLVEFEGAGPCPECDAIAFDFFRLEIFVE